MPFPANATSAQGAVPVARALRSWPYRLAAVGLALGVAGLVLAPIGAAVYMALPAIALGTWFAFVDRCPFLGVFVSSLAAFALGLTTGLVVLYVSASSSGSFAAQGFGFFAAATALWFLPLVGLVLGGIALLGAHYRPGVPDSALRRDDFEPV